jgi:hypothetical protein
MIKLFTYGQYEGFSYFGLGNLVILPFAFILFFSKDFSHRHLFFLLTFLIVAIFLSLFALSNVAFLNDHIFWNSDWSLLAKQYLSGQMVLCQVDGFTIVLSEENEIIPEKANLTSSYTFPKF